jgi:hypothetical protein
MIKCYIRELKEKQTEILDDITSMDGDNHLIEKNYKETSEA